MNNYLDSFTSKQTTPTSSKSKALLASCLVLAVTSAANVASGATLIYEDFNQSAGDLNSQSSGTGLSGNWSGDTRAQVLTGSLSFGSLATSGNKIGISSTTGSGSISVGTGTTLSGAGVLDDGADLWFSFLTQVPSGATANKVLLFNLGDQSVTGLNAGPTVGFGARMNPADRLQATRFDGGFSNNSVESGMDVGTYLVVGHIQWNAAGTDDTLDLYLPDAADLSVTGASLGSIGADFSAAEQASFDTLSFWGNGDHPIIDEIRFGESYADVAVVPEPSTMASLMLGMFGLLLRRRRR